jgi:hypothetical protein
MEIVKKVSYSIIDTSVPNVPLCPLLFEFSLKDTNITINFVTLTSLQICFFQLGRLNSKTLAITTANTHGSLSNNVLLLPLL